MKVTVVAHQPEWHLTFEKEKQLITEIIGTNAVGIHHIGSTAVPHLLAKPVIDILVVVKSLDELDCCANCFRAIDYEPMGEFGIAARRFYRKGKKKRTHHIHAFQYDNVSEIFRHLVFRDYLIAHPTVAFKYAQLKKELADIYETDINGYCEGKDAFVKRTEADALIWAWQSPE